MDIVYGLLDILLASLVIVTSKGSLTFKREKFLKKKEIITNWKWPRLFVCLFEFVTRNFSSHITLVKVLSPVSSNRLFNTT